MYAYLYIHVFTVCRNRYDAASGNKVASDNKINSEF